MKVQHLLPLLDDPVRLVRIDAARALASVPQEPLTESSAGRSSGAWPNTSRPNKLTPTVRSRI